VPKLVHPPGSENEGDPSLSGPEAPGPTVPSIAPLAPRNSESDPQGEGNSNEIGPYVLLSELGRGNKGVVHLVQRGTLPRRFALKILHGHPNPKTLARFELEARLASQVQHPGVVSVFDLGSHKGCPYFVMEYCPGPTLEQSLLTRGALKPRDAADLVRELASTLAAVHSLGTIHRDLKPSNVILDERQEGRPRLTDFGVARNQSLSDLTRTGEVLGSPVYMAPEQLLGKRIDASADVYALGVLFYECLCGALPFCEATMIDLAEKIQAGECVRPSVYAPGLPAELERICLWAMRRESTDRPSAEELAAALEAFLVPASVGGDGGGGLAGAVLGRLSKPGKPALAVGVLTLLVFAGVIGLRNGLAPTEDETRGAAAPPRDELERGPEPPTEGQPQLDPVLLRRLKATKLLKRAQKLARAREPYEVVQPLLDSAEKLAPAGGALSHAVQLEQVSLAYRRGRYERVPALVEGIGKTPGRVGYWARYLHGLSLFRLEHSAESTRVLEDVARDDPQGGAGLCAGAFLCTVVWGEAQRGEELARRALATGACNGDAGINLAFALHNQGRKAEGWTQAQVALKAAPDHPRGHLAKGYLLQGLGDVEGAHSGYSEVIRLTEPRPMLRALRHRAELALTRRNYRAVISDLSRVLKVKPDEPRALLLRGLSYRTEGRLADSLADLKRAKRLHPTEFPAALRKLVTPADFERLERELER
jgi:tetratricopeptide (TPR) repeat protein